MSATYRCCCIYHFVQMNTLFFLKTLNNNYSAEISHESSGCSQCLLEFLLERLQVESCHVKLKVRTNLQNSSSFHRAKFLLLLLFSLFLVCMWTSEVFVSVFVTLGAEDLCPSLQPSWVRAVPYRTAKELYLHPASFRFIFVLG